MQQQFVIHRRACSSIIVHCTDSQGGRTCATRVACFGGCGGGGASNISVQARKANTLTDELVARTVIIIIIIIIIPIIIVVVIIIINTVFISNAVVVALVANIAVAGAVVIVLGSVVKVVSSIARLLSGGSRPRHGRVPPFQVLQQRKHLRLHIYTHGNGVELAHVECTRFAPSSANPNPPLSGR